MNALPHLPLCPCGASPLLGETKSCRPPEASPVRGGGSVKPNRRGYSTAPPIFPRTRPPRGLPTVLLRTTSGAQQARSGGEPVEENAFPRLSFHGVDRHFPSVLQMGRSSGTPPLIRIRARHRCEFVWHRFVKAKAIAAQSAEIPKDKGSFGVSFSAIFLHEKKDGIPEGRFPLRSGKLVPEQSDFA